MWLPADLLGVDLLEMSNQLQALSTRASQAQEELPPNTVFEHLNRQLRFILELIPVLEVLQNPHLRSRHWTQLSEAVGLIVLKDGKPCLTFGQASRMNRVHHRRFRRRWT